jgi:NADH dehydrogenase
MKTQVVVVGGGAGGLELVRKLGVELRNMDVDVVLLEQARTHIWKPLLHEVAAGSLDANMDEVGYASHGHRWNYRYFFGSLEAIDRKARQATVAPILGEDGTELFGRHRIPYDYLVIAVGSVSNDFGTPGVAEHCLFLENRIQADRFRLRLLDHCLRVSLRLRENPSADAHVDVAIVGGGATGVELAAELYNAATALEQYGLHAFDPQRMRITLIEAGPRILPALPEKLAEAAKQELEALGVRVLENTVVTEATRGAMRTASGEEIRADMLVWAAGVRGPAFVQNLDGLELTRSNQLVVSSTLQTTRDERIFAIGDCCSYTPEGATQPVPPRAQAAHQMAATAQQNIVNLIQGQKLEDFVYRDRGSLVSLSRFSTVGSLMGNLVGGRMAIEGRLARLVYLSLYNMHLIAIHGWLKGLALIVVGHANRVVRPKLKLH